jgi:hypothetical protein
MSVYREIELLLAVCIFSIRPNNQKLLIRQQTLDNGFCKDLNTNLSFLLTFFSRDGSIITVCFFLLRLE